jgi:hypothetical protein
MIGSVRG